MKFNENHFRGNRVVPCGQADRQTDRHKQTRMRRHDETDSRLLQFCERSQNNKNQRNTIIKTDKVRFHVLSRISLIIEGVGKENMLTHTELLNSAGIIIIISFYWIHSIF